MIYSLKQIGEMIEPIARKYNIKAVWVFGSYARGEATDTSDVDLVIDLSGCISVGWDVYAIFDEIGSALGKETDIVTEHSITSPTRYRGQKRFRKAVLQERVKVYDRAS